MILFLIVVFLVIIGVAISPIYGALRALEETAKKASDGSASGFLVGAVALTVICIGIVVLAMNNA